MLQRKLFIRIGLLIVCFVAGAAVAVYLLQGAIPDIERINRDAITLVDGAQTAGDCIARIEDARNGVPGVGPAAEADAEARLVAAVDAVGAHHAVTDASSLQARSYQSLVAVLPSFLDPSGLTAEQELANRSAVRAAARDLARSLRAYTAEEQTWFGRYFRGLVLGLTLAALIMVNIAVFVLFRTAQLVLKPVGELVRCSRELAAEHFEHRVSVPQKDEFGELAMAYNRLAEQLQANEERKAEAIRQLAVTLNHDLNNAIATIELQLALLDRQSGSDGNLSRYLREIQTSLSRMSRTVASLKHIRRVVLTDYVVGQKMVDLERSMMPPPLSTSGASSTGV